MRYAFPQQQSTTVKPSRPAAASSSAGGSSRRKSFTWSYLPRIDALMRPSASAIPATRRNADESNDVRGRAFILSCGFTVASRSSGFDREARTWPFRVTRTWRSPFAVIRWRSLAPFWEMISSSPSKAPAASKFLTVTRPFSRISAWKRFSPPMETGRSEILNCDPLRRTLWTIFTKPSPKTPERISSAREGSSSNLSITGT